jgi:hypothetical protein
MPHRTRRTASENEEFTQRLGLTIATVLGVVLVAGIVLIVRGLL